MFQLVFIGEDRGQIGFYVNVQAVLLPLQYRRHRPADGFDYRGQGDRLRFYLDRARFYLGQVEHAVNQGEQVLAAVQYAVEAFPLFLVYLAGRLVNH